MERAIILGASRGLGNALATLITQKGIPTTGYSRKIALHATQPKQADFSKPEDQDKTIAEIKEMLTPQTTIFYIAGGGPFGPYPNRQWKDHMWAFETSFLFPAKLLHAIAKTKPQVILVGSSVAESNPDPHAASYAAAKHALKGLVVSLQKEIPDWDLRLFSPGYMDTDMLPLNAKARQQKVHSPRHIAEDLWQWSQEEKPEQAHKIYPHHATT